MKTVLCHGVFDVLHHGHLEYLQEAKTFGDKLIVSVTPDQFVNKGPGRPYFPGEKRVSMLRALAVVDEVFINDSATACSAIERVKPDFYVKGPDYRNLNDDVTGEIVNEKVAVERYGGKLVFTGGETNSSSTIINRFLAPWTDEQKNAQETIRQHGGMGAITNALEKISKLKILVIGEPILDVYRFVRPEGISSKSPSISARFEKEESYYGGSWAIENHLRSFTTQELVLQPHVRVSKKIRYISGNQRIFEVTEIDESSTGTEWLADKIKDLSKQVDVVVAADFGHGMFEGPVLSAMHDINTFIGLNVQTNSSNFGFNRVSKHDHWDYLCIDLREARLELGDRFSDPHDILGALKHQYGGDIAMTLGPAGARLGKHTCPAFADNILDATGAGDAFFAITTCLMKTGCHPDLVLFIGNVFAGLKTKIIGNKSSVSKAQLIKACGGILK